MDLCLIHWCLEEFLRLRLVHRPAGLGRAVLAASLHQLHVRPDGLNHWGGDLGAEGGHLQGDGWGGHLKGAGGGGGIPLEAGATLLSAVAASVGQFGGHECF